MWIRIWILLLVKATTDLKTPQGSILSLYASIVTLWAATALYGSILSLWSSRISTLMPIRIQLPRIMGLRIRNPGLKHSYLFFLRLSVLKHLIFETSPADSQSWPLKTRFLFKSFFVPSEPRELFLPLFTFVTYSPSELSPSTTELSHLYWACEKVSFSVAWKQIFYLTLYCTVAPD